MITLAEAKESIEFTKDYPRLDKWPRLIRHYSFYDGPLSGICLYEGKEHFFKMVKEFDYEEEEDGEMEMFLGRIYAITELAPEQFATMNERHDVWQDYVGCHTNYDENNKRKYMSEDGGRARIEYNWDKYHEEMKSKPDFPSMDNNKVVAWWGDSSFNFDAYTLKGAS